MFILSPRTEYCEKYQTLPKIKKAFTTSICKINFTSKTTNFHKNVNKKAVNKQDFLQEFKVAE